MQKLTKLFSCEINIFPLVPFVPCAKLFLGFVKSVNLVTLYIPSDSIFLKLQKLKAWSQQAHGKKTLLQSCAKQFFQKISKPFGGLLAAYTKYKINLLMVIQGELHNLNTLYTMFKLHDMKKY